MEEFYGQMLDQDRTHNHVNEIDVDDNHGNAAGASITASTGTNWFDPTYYAAGNMSSVPKPADLANGFTLKWDAWNRLVEVKDGQTPIGFYDYLCPCQLTGGGFSPPGRVCVGCFSGGWGAVVAGALGFLLAA